MFLNETICIVESKYSGQKVLDVGALNGMGIAFAIGIIAFLGFVIRGLFIYYIKYEAPGDRPINTMIFSDQVSNNDFAKVSITTKDVIQYFRLLKWPQCLPYQSQQLYPS